MISAKNKDEAIEKLFSVGAHFGLIRSRRHPTAAPFIYGAKNKIEIFDLEKVNKALQTAKEFLKKAISAGGTVLFVGTKNEARGPIEDGARSALMPYVSDRWLGGTLTNFTEIRKRVMRLEDLVNQKEKGELSKYTKKERLLIDREIATLDKFFSGLTLLKGLPKALFVIDSRHENIAVREASRLGIPVVSLSSSDCNFWEVEYPIPGNDASKTSIRFFVNEIVNAIEEGKKHASAPNEAKAEA